MGTRRTVFGCLASVGLGASGLAAQAGPHAACVFPAGAQRGTTVEVEVRGQRLRGATGAVISGSGIDAQFVKYVRILPQKEVNALRSELRKLQQRRSASLRRRAGQRGRTRPRPPWTAVDEHKLTALRETLADRERRRTLPALSESVFLRIRVAPTAARTSRELRVRTGAGLSTPLVFVIGDLPEVREVDEGRLAWPRREARRRGGAIIARAEPVTRLELPVVVSGRIMPGDTDLFRFSARKGQRLVLRVRARNLVPYLADAVPGWFQPTLSLRTAAGREVAFDDDWRFDPDPVVLFEVREDGDYVAEVRDAIYRGREDFGYRLEIGELPFVTAVFPLGARVGTHVTVAVEGWNLPVRRQEVTAPARAGVAALHVKAGRHVSNDVPFAAGGRPELIEREPNDSRQAAQFVAPGTVVNGRIAQPGDRDVYAVAGRAGQAVVVDVVARRLGSPLDSVVVVRDVAGKVIGSGDDHEDRAAGLVTHQADSWLRFDLPADGRAFVEIADVQDHGGSAWAYRIRIGPPEPDFTLLVTPSSLQARSGQHVPFTVHVVRRDGFSGPVDLGLRGAPRGFTISGGRVPAGADKLVLTLHCPLQRVRGPVALRLAGTARVAGRLMTHGAVAADDCMQAFLNRHLVPARHWWVTVAGRGSSAPAVKVASKLPLHVEPGTPSELSFGVARASDVLKRITLQLVDPPPGITLDGVVAKPNRLTLKLRIAAKVEAGLAGNLIVEAIQRVAPQRGGRRGRRRRLGALPAVPFTVTATREKQR